MNYEHDTILNKDEAYNQIKTIIGRAGELIGTKGLCIISHDADWKATYSFYDFINNRVLLYYIDSPEPADVVVLDENEEVIILNPLETLFYRKKIKFALDIIDGLCKEAGLTMYTDITEDNIVYLVIFNPTENCGYGIMSGSEKTRYALCRIEQHKDESQQTSEIKKPKCINDTELGRHFIELRRLTAVNAIAALRIYADDEGRKNCNKCVYDNEDGLKLCEVLFNKDIIEKTSLDICYSGKLQKHYNRDFHKEYNSLIGEKLSNIADTSEQPHTSHLELNEEHQKDIRGINNDIMALLINAVKYK